MVFVGISGFFYREWRGIFYPEDLPQSKWLSFYSKHFNGLEVNSTFYRLPKKSSLKRLKRDGESLGFVFKLYRGITHYRKLTDENISPFLEVKEILGERLICLLAQFPSSFRPNQRNLEFLNSLIDRFGNEGILISVELRNSDWKDFLKEIKTTVVCSYFPEGLNWLRDCNGTEELSYFRFHGKELYRGSYSDDELREISERIRKAKSRVKAAFFNNTADGSAVFNALKLKELLGL
ncbi:Uncharacterized conserved protein YecE, DUF72 family [Balnearium lithotrophicum]|uniref:Uncharacterized conserved protein YecE, DUF72 family n=1 Tax=Balnearium lithotrophicum TaxID=223788 RepID=A0A521BH36_9BACT|nr:DUF72 domain-containing protein [Balnearium lithotrophicum]SMO46406.1 Uncharacterized conserved protein YecE, DUF72 family [Balnearium lithotrophicum]